MAQAASWGEVGLAKEASGVLLLETVEMGEGLSLLLKGWIEFKAKSLRTLEMVLKYWPTCELGTIQPTPTHGQP